MSYRAMRRYLMVRDRSGHGSEQFTVTR